MLISVWIELYDSTSLGQTSHPCLSLGGETGVVENQQLATGCIDAWIIKRYVEKGWNQSHYTELCQSHVHSFSKSNAAPSYGAALESDSSDRRVSKSSPCPEQREVQRVSV